MIALEFVLNCTSAHSHQFLVRMDNIKPMHLALLRPCWQGEDDICLLDYEHPQIPEHSDETLPRPSLNLTFLRFLTTT